MKIKHPGYWSLAPEWLKYRGFECLAAFMDRVQELQLKGKLGQLFPLAPDGEAIRLRQRRVSIG